MKLVDQLFDLIFAEKFEDNADNVIDTYAYHDAILDHIPEDDGMQEPLLALFDPDKQHEVTRQEIRDALKGVCRSRLDEFQDNVDKANDETNDILEKTGGTFAHGYIEKLFLAFDERRAMMELEPDNKTHRIEQPF